MLQEHKVPEDECNKIGALGVRKGKSFWNGGCYNALKDRWKAGTFGYRLWNSCPR
jgi:hypothetical protein